MIDVLIYEGLTKLAVMKIEEFEEHDDGWTQFTVRFMVDRGPTIGLHTRAFMFRKNEGNVLAMVQSALMTLDEEELVMEDGRAGASDLARGQRGIGTQVSGEEEDTVRNH